MSFKLQASHSNVSYLYCMAPDKDSLRGYLLSSIDELCNPGGSGTILRYLDLIRRMLANETFGERVCLAENWAANSHKFSSLGFSLNAVYHQFLKGAPYYISNEECGYFLLWSQFDLYFSLIFCWLQIYIDWIVLLHVWIKNRCNWNRIILFGCSPMNLSTFVGNSQINCLKSIDETLSDWLSIEQK